MACITLAVTLQSLFLAHFLPPAAVYVIAPLALFAVFVALGRHMRCRCPRCGDLFNITKVRGHVWASECAHCGLPLRHSADIFARTTMVGLFFPLDANNEAIR